MFRQRKKQKGIEDSPAVRTRTGCDTSQIRGREFMASVSKDKKGYRVRFVMPDGANKTIRLAGFNKSKCEDIARHVEELIAAKAAGAAIDRRTANWLADIGQNVHDKLSNAGLVEQRVSFSLGEFIADYIKRRSDVAPGTTMNFGTCERNLVDYFGHDKAMRSIKHSDAIAFRQWLEENEGQAENTIRRRCGRARQFFKAAMKSRLIDENPFDDMPVTVSGSTKKERFVTEAESQKILKACPDLQWRLIFSLCRYGGMRCPSEILALRWENVLWDSNRIIVTSPKTKRYKGHENRVIPMFPELAHVLNEAYEMAFDRLEDKSAVVSGPVVTRYTSARQNLRTTFEKIVTRAGLIPWPKPFQNLRSTRETELMEIYPSHVVVSWIGHSEKVARQHYLQTTDAHFEKAVLVKPAETVASSETETTNNPSDTVAIQVASETREMEETGKPSKAKSPENTNVFRDSADAFAHLRRVRLPRRDSNPN
jgi:integrase